MVTDQRLDLGYLPSEPERSQRQQGGRQAGSGPQRLRRLFSQPVAARMEKRQLYAQVAEAWNAFEAEHGSFADEHSTL